MTMSISPQLPAPGPLHLSVALTPTSIERVMASYDPITSWIHNGHEGTTFRLVDVERGGASLIFRYRGLTYGLAEEGVRGALLKLLDQTMEAADQLDIAALPDELSSNEDPIVHASGFPGWGPPTLCGEPGPTPAGGCGEVTCQRCNDLLGDASKLAARVEELVRAIGKPTMSANRGTRGAAVLKPVQEPVGGAGDARALVAAIRALTVDVDEGREPNGEAERQMGRFLRALSREVWAPLFGHGYVHEDKVRPLILEALDAAQGHATALAERLRALRLSAEAYFGGDFG